MVYLDVNISAVETLVGEDGLREAETGLASSAWSSFVVASADVGVVVRGTAYVVGPICTWLPSVVRAPSVEVCGTGILALVVRCSFSGVVCTTMAPGVKASVLDRVLGLVAGEWVVWEVEDIKAGDIGATLVLVAGRAGSVEDPIKAGDHGVPGGRLIVTALVGSVG